MKFHLTFLSVAWMAGAAFGAGDFFGTPEKTVVAKPAATPAPATPAPGTPTPVTSGPFPTQVAPVLTPDETDPLFLKTPIVGGGKDWGASFHDVGPDNGVLIGFEYSTSVTDSGTTVIQSIQPIYVRAAGKARGTLRGKLKPGNPATMLESRPGFAVAAVDARGDWCLEGFKVTFMRCENGKLDPSEKYTSKWCGGDGGDNPMKHLATDTRPIYGIFGRGGPDLNEFGLLIRKDPIVAKDATSVATTTPFGSPVPPGTQPMENGADKLTGGGTLQPAVFDTSYLETPQIAGAKKGWGTATHDLAPMGAMLIGFDFTTGLTDKGDPSIKSLQPVYRLVNGSVKLGTLLGTSEGRATRSMAKDGYALSAMDGRGGGVVAGFQLTFSRVKGSALDPSDTYQSDWFGATEGQFTRVSGEGRQVTGIAGKFGNDVNALALLVKKDASASSLTSTRPTVPSMTPSPNLPPVPIPSATPAPAVAGGVEVFAVAEGEFTLFLNGREILSGSSPRDVPTTTAPIVKGDVITAVVKDTGGNPAWFSMRIVRDGKTVLDAGDMHYLTTESLNWKTNKLMSGFKDPKVWTHEKKMGTDSRPRAAWVGPKDAAVTTVYFKGIVP